MQQRHEPTNALDAYLSGSLARLAERVRSAPRPELEDPERLLEEDHVVTLALVVRGEASEQHEIDASFCWVPVSTLADVRRLGRDAPIYHVEATRHNGVEGAVVGEAIEVDAWVELGWC